MANLPETIASAQRSSTFSYGPDNDRYYQAATDNGVSTDTTYIGGLFEELVTQTSTEYRHNINADGQVVAVHTIDENGNATTSYLHYDHLGSVDTITDDQGNIAQQMSFDAFGLRRDAANWDYDLTTAQITALKDDTDRGYTFQEQLDNVGLIHMNGRVYDPSIGRFISADPTVPDPLYSQLQGMCASNLIFCKSSRSSDVPYPMYADMCWPVHKRILEIVSPQCIVTIGNSERRSAYSYLKALLLKTERNDTMLVQATSSGHARYALKAFKAQYSGRPLMVIGVPHLSYYSLTASGPRENVRIFISDIMSQL